MTPCSSISLSFRFLIHLRFTQGQFKTRTRNQRRQGAAARIKARDSFPTFSTFPLRIDSNVFNIPSSISVAKKRIARGAKLQPMHPTYQHVNICKYGRWLASQRRTGLPTRLARSLPMLRNCSLRRDTAPVAFKREKHRERERDNSMCCFAINVTSDEPRISRDLARKSPRNRFRLGSRSTARLFISPSRDRPILHGSRD